MIRGIGRRSRSGRGEAGIAMAAALFGATSPAVAEEPLRPGVALPPELLTPEARAYEAALQGNEVAPEGNTVVERRQFNERFVHLGVGSGQGTPVGVLGLYVELEPLDRLALGAGIGLTFWGAATGGYLRFRPLVWGGQGKKLLNALTLQASYAYMAYGEPVWEGLASVGCHAGCYAPRAQATPAHFGAFQAGIEHSLWSGWSIHYGIGVAQSLTQVHWSCTVRREAAACEGVPGNTLFVASVGVGYGF